jgi:hypothetical protein
MLLLSASGWFVYKAFGPFPSGAEPRLYRVTQLVRAADDGFARTENSPVLIRLSRGEKELSWSVTVYDQSGKPNRIPGTVSAMMIPNWAYVADLNRDRQADYIVEMFSGGNGIPASDVVFIVSSGKAFEATTFRSYAPSEDDYVDLLQDGRFQYIQPMFVFSYAKGRDGKAHNYWVYNIYSLDGSSFSLQNDMSPGFPKWVMYAGRTNHKATEQLTEEQKREAWHSREQCVMWKPDDPCAVAFR